MCSVVYRPVNVYSIQLLDSVFPQASALKGFPCLDACKQDLPVSVFFSSATHSSATVFEDWLQWIFEGWLPPPSSIGPTLPHCISAAQELLSFSTHVLPGRAGWLGVSLPGQYPCLVDKVPTNWSSPNVVAMWNNWAPWYLEGQLVLDSRKMPFSFGRSSFFCNSFWWIFCWGLG